MGVQSQKLVRGTVIAAGVAAIAGFGIGLAGGTAEDPADLPEARRLPSDLCARLGEVSALFPARVQLQQTGGAEVRCTAEVDEDTQPSFTGAELTVTARTYAGSTGSTAADVAREDFDDEQWPAVAGRVNPTKMNSKPNGEDSWRIDVVSIHGDTLVRVGYSAEPIARQAAESAALALADRSVWEAR
jgi:hypothetical protein